MSVDLHVADKELLFKALDAAGLSFVVLANGYVAVNTPEGQIVLGDQCATLPAEAEPHLNTIRRGYSREVLRQASKKFRFTVTEKEEDHVVIRGY
jgi:hypothetical protein